MPWGNASVFVGQDSHLVPQVPESPGVLLSRTWGHNHEKRSITGVPSSGTGLFLVGLAALSGMVALASLQISGSEATQQARRRAMVENQLRRGGIRNQAVLAAMEKVPRHRFVPPLCEAWPTRTVRCRSARGKRSPSRTSWRS